METSSAESELQIAVTVASERPLHLLQSQLAKLIDVIHVESAEAPMVAADSFLSGHNQRKHSNVKDHQIYLV